MNLPAYITLKSIIIFPGLGSYLNFCKKMKLRKYKDFVTLAELCGIPGLSYNGGNTTMCAVNSGTHLHTHVMIC